MRKKASVEKRLCVACGTCDKICPINAIKIFKGMYAKIDKSKCVGCGQCVKECPASIISLKEVQI